MSTELGRQAETAAAQYLHRKGHEQLARNWRTRWCEIDLITRHDDTVYFVEVKYRGNNRHGTGLDYITSRKLAQMHYAADFWLSRQRQGEPLEYRLAAIEVSGATFVVTAWLDDL